MKKNSFDSHNPRVRYAREKWLLNNRIILVLLFVLFIILITSGITLLILGYPICWSLIGFSVVPIMFIFWIKNFLSFIPIKNTNNFTDIISEDLLRSLKERMTPLELVEILPKTRG